MVLLLVVQVDLLVLVDHLLPEGQRHRLDLSGPEDPEGRSILQDRSCPLLLVLLEVLVDLGDQADPWPL